MPRDAERLVMLTLVPEMPPENVEVAELVLRIEPAVIVSPLAETSPPPFTERPLDAQVLVAVALVCMVEVAIRPAMDRLSLKRPSPCTEKSLPGLVVPVPTLPPKKAAE
jgi:hypothetical protein